jgi:hypothetical protein
MSFHIRLPMLRARQMIARPTRCVFSRGVFPHCLRGVTQLG